MIGQSIYDILIKYTISRTPPISEYTNRAYNVCIQELRLIRSVFPLLKIGVHESLVWLLATGRLTIRNLSFLFISSLIAILLPFIDPLSHGILSTWVVAVIIVIPMSRILSLIFVTYFSLIYYIQNNAMIFINHHTPPLSKSKEHTLPGKEFKNPSFEKFLDFYWLNAHILSLATVTLAILISEGAIETSSIIPWPELKKLAKI